MQVDNFQKSDFPLLVFKKNDCNIYYFKNHFGIVSKGGEGFYENLTVITSNGEIFSSVDKKLKGSAELKYFLKYFQKMYKVDVFFKAEKKTLSLIEFKKMIDNHIRKYPNKSYVLDTLEDITRVIEETENFKELFVLFK